MKIADLITRSNVITDLRVADKNQLLAELSRRAANVINVDQSIIFDALRAREALGSTGLGRGFALPHARLDKISDFFALFVRLARPIEFESIDDRPVDLAILLLIPAAAGNQHLATLASLSRPLRDQALVRRLREAPNAAALHELLASA